MVERLTKLKDYFSRNNRNKALSKYKLGIEREALRINSSGALSLSSHPKALGSALSNKYISTDFSESQLELITPTFTSYKNLNTFCNNLHKFVAKSLKNELIWPFSMPCHLPKEHEIPIAEYGRSDTGYEKSLYRQGLVTRYGINMQMISGIHYNFSFSDELFQSLGSALKRDGKSHEFKSEQYFHVIRNYLHYGWILTYLFGASPIVHKSYFPADIPEDFEEINKETYCLKDSTSLRMSQFGYYNKTKCQHTISLDNLPNYLKDLEFAISTPCHEFTKLGIFDPSGRRIQMNDHLLQIENEHYTRIRPKAIFKRGETHLHALLHRGVSYLEVRSIDIDPSDPIGIRLEKMTLVHLFLLFCLFKDSRSIKEKKCQQMLLKNQNDVGLFGNRKSLMLRDFSEEKEMHSWMLEILHDMLSITDLLDGKEKQSYINCVKAQIEKVEGKIQTPSEKLIEDVMKKGYLELGIERARSHKDLLLSNKDKTHSLDYFKEEAKTSLERQKKLEEHEYFELKDYEDMELSTQVLIRACKRRNISFDIIDREENLLLLKRGEKKELVKQATITHHDSFLHYHLLESKHVTKTLLSEKGLNVPQGATINYLEDLKAVLSSFSKKNLVIKPAKTNCGLGISFVKASDKKEVQKAIDEAFSYGSCVILEEYVKGDEYRVLVIDNKVVGVLRRLPANVKGDGVHTVKELVEIKNKDPKYFKTHKERIILGKEELLSLKELGYKQSSIPKKSQTIFLRKNSNVSTGGDAEDYTDTLPDYFEKIALKATEAIGVKICGVDMIIPSLKKDNYSIIELNYNPNIAMHYYPSKGKKIEVAEALLDFLKL